MGEYCELCGSERKLVEGISKKSGKPFKGWFCSKKGCESKPKFIKIDQEQPKETTTSVQDSPKTAPVAPTSPVKEEKVDWDSKEKRIVRQSVLKTATELVKIIRTNIPLEEFNLQENYIGLTKMIAQEFENWVYRETDTPITHSEPVVTPESNTTATSQYADMLKSIKERPLSDVIPTVTPESNTTATSQYADMLKSMSKMKQQLNALTGDDHVYYSILGENGWTHANEIKDVETGRNIYKLLQSAYKQAAIEDVASENGGSLAKGSDVRDYPAEANEEF